MAELKNHESNESITRFVSLDTIQEATRVIHKTFDGGQYIQRIGDPTVMYIVRVYITSQGKEQLMQAEDLGQLLKVIVGSGTYYGRIIDLTEFEKLTSDYYKTTMVVC